MPKQQGSSGPGPKRSTSRRTPQAQGGDASHEQVQSVQGDEPRIDGPTNLERQTPASELSQAEFNARVARKAFELFERRGRDDGRDVEDWLEAERQVRGEGSGNYEAPSR